MQTPPLPASRASTSSGTLRGWSHTARAEECEKSTGASRDVERVAHGVGRHVREVDEHPEPVHLAHHLAAERREPAEHRLVGRRVGPRHVLVVGEGQVAHPERVQHPQRAERGVDAVPALGADQRGDPALRAGALDVGDGRREGQVGRRYRAVMRVHRVDLLQRGGDGGVALQRAGHPHRPELGAHATLAQPREVGVGRAAGAGRCRAGPSRSRPARGPPRRGRCDRRPRGARRGGRGSGPRCPRACAGPYRGCTGRDRGGN